MKNKSLDELPPEMGVLIRNTVDSGDNRTRAKEIDGRYAGSNFVDSKGS
jgi:hypothetical protein